MRKLVLLMILPLALGGLLPPAQAKAPALTLSVSKSSVDVGKRITLKGKATQGAAAGARVQLQVKLPGTSIWRTIKTVGLSDARTYRTRVRVSAPGDNRYRAVIGATKSATRIVTGYAWLSLTEQSAYVNGTSFLDATAILAGKAYPHSILANSSFSITWRLSRCTEVRTTLGRAENGGASAIGQYSASFNALIPNNFPDTFSFLVNGDPQVVAHPLPAGVFQLSLDLYSFSGFPIAGVGSPRVRCAVASLPVMDTSDLP